MKRLGQLTLVMAFLLGAQGLGGAATIDTYEPAVDQAQFQGQITAVNAEHDTFVVIERQVCLVDFVRTGLRFRTSVQRLDGTPLDPAELKLGDWVAVKGAVLAGKRIGAQVIYVLPHQLSREQVQSYQQLLTEPVWGVPLP